MNGPTTSIGAVLLVESGSYGESMGIRIPIPPAGTRIKKNMNGGAPKGDDWSVENGHAQ
jgi:hypothetical protein